MGLTRKKTSSARVCVDRHCHRTNVLICIEDPNPEFARLLHATACKRAPNRSGNSARIGVAQLYNTIIITTITISQKKDYYSETTAQCPSSREPCLMLFIAIVAVARKVERKLFTAGGVTGNTLAMVWTRTFWLLFALHAVKMLLTRFSLFCDLFSFFLHKVTGT